MHTATFRDARPGRHGLFAHGAARRDFSASGLRLAVLLLAAFALGGLSLSVERSASAKSATPTSTMYVPAGGLAFRGPNGHVFARLSDEAHGGLLELYDEHEQPSAYVGAAPSPERSTAPILLGPQVPGQPSIDLGY